jgi:hypothetical protein
VLKKALTEALRSPAVSTRCQVKTMMEDNAALHLHFHENDDGVDGCICEFEFDESDVLAGADVPPTAYKQWSGNTGGPGSIEGCDADFDAHEVTINQKPLITAGGVLI